MKYSHIELIPTILKPSRPSQYDGESFTVLEYVAVNSSKVNECITEYNKFVDEVVKECTNHKNIVSGDIDLFKRTIEQKFQDFIRLIELKYGKQDLVISDAVAYMKTNLANSVRDAIYELSENNEFNDIILTAIDNLNTRFDTTVESVESLIEASTTKMEEMEVMVNDAIFDMQTETGTAINNTTDVIDDANEAINNVNDALAALNLAIADMDGGNPTSNEEGEEFDGTNV